MAMTMKRFNKLVLVIYNIIRLIALKTMYKSKISFDKFEMLSPSTIINIGMGSISFGIGVMTNDHCNISTKGGGSIIIGNNTGLNRNCNVVSHEKIVIGENVSIGPNVCIYDHDHKFNNKGIIPGEYSCKQIRIGNDVWIGANCIILAGADIGDNVVIGAGSIVKGNIPSHSIYYDKKNAVIKKMEE